MSRAIVPAAAAALVILVVFLAPSGSSVSQETGGLSQVYVTNWPEVFPVRGDVSVKSIRRAELISFEEIVPPVQPSDTNRLVSAGVLSADGYPAVVLSLVGQTKVQVLKPGAVGAILLPDVEPVALAFQERAEPLFRLEVAGTASPSSPWFASDQPRFLLGFPRYRVLLYNKTDKTVTVTLYAYLTS